MKEDDVFAGSAPANNGMHPTRDTTAVINLNGAGGRVMLGVRFLLSAGIGIWEEQSYIR